MTRLWIPILLAGLASSASAITFDFESLAASYDGAGSRPGGYTSANQTANGLTLTVTREQGAAFDVYGYGSPDPYAGRRFLDGFNVPQERAFVLDFSAPLSEFSIFLGQFNASLPRNAALRAYSGAGGTGALLMESTGTIPSASNGFGNFTGIVLSVNGSAIRSVTATMNGAFNNGFLDNGSATVAPVPEPASLAVLGLGVFSAFRRRRALGRAR